MKCFVAIPVCLTQTTWKAASCTTSGMAPAIKSGSAWWRRFHTKKKASVQFLEVWTERIISIIARCMGLRSIEVSTLLLWLANATQPSVLHWICRRLIAMARQEQLAALTQKMRLPDAALQLAIRRQHIAMNISEIVLVGYGQSSLKTLLTMSHLSQKKFVNDKVFRFYRMCQTHMLCVICFVTKIQAAILISFWRSLEDQDHIRKITKCKGVKRQWSLFF